MKIIFALLFSAFSLLEVSAQTHYWVFFNDPAPIGHQSVNGNYLKKLASKNVTVIGSSKWFNAAYISIDNTKHLRKIEKLPFVKSIEKSRKYKVQQLAVQSDSLNYGQADVQLKMLGLNKYHNLGNTGKGVVIALFDAGFYKLDSLKAFDSLIKRGGILANRDFFANDSIVYDDDAHGMHVLSLIAGYVKDSLNGSAPDAQFVLARTEDAATEKHIEEFNWIRALEWADSIGVDIIHSSLGYALFDSLEGDYKFQDMDGKSTIITRAAELAYKRGIFITNSAGNEGRKPWHYITAPCDGPNVLCIGAVDSFRQHAPFSSYGPSADGRVKPDVMAMGKNATIMGTNNAMRRGNGTSFSGPIMAGFVACLKQAFPTVDNAILLDAIRKSGHLYTTPNDSMGYGIPDIMRADSLVKRKLSASIPAKPNFKMYPNPCGATLIIQSNIAYSSVEIIDAVGRVYLPALENNVVNMSGLNPGLYFIRLTGSQNKTGAMRLVKL